MRRLPDPFSLGELCSSGSRCSAESYALARELSTVVGPMTPLIARYWAALSFAPPEDLGLLKRTSGTIVFARTIADALTCGEAERRRDRTLTTAESEMLRCDDWLQAGVYDPRCHLLAFPTRHRAGDLERVALHELGHALTMRQVAPYAAERVELLEGLPVQIARHVDHPQYIVPNDRPATTAARVLEAIADAYVWLLAGRGSELSAALRTELLHALGEARAFI